MGILLRLGGLTGGIALASHAPDMNSQFINLTSSEPETVILFQIAFIAIGIGVFLNG